MAEIQAVIGVVPGLVSGREIATLYLSQVKGASRGMAQKDTGKATGQAAGGRRKAKPVTADRLHKAALHYLERYASSSANLRKVLMRRVERSVRDYGTDRDEGEKLVENLVTRFQDAGLLDDRAYAENRAASLLRRGTSLKAVRMKLAAKGVPAVLIDEVLEAAREESDGDADWLAAIAYVRRRRIGPYRVKAREENRDRDMAALARQGFSFEVARKILDTDSADELEAFI